MVKALTVVRPVSKFSRGLLALLLLALLIFPAPVRGQEAYGSENYGGCDYQVDCPATVTSTTTSTSSTSATASTSDTTNVVLNVLSDFFTETGASVSDLSVGDVVEFCIGKTTVFQSCDATSETRHTATIKSIDLAAGVVVLTIASITTDYTFTLDTPKLVDVNGDGVDDLEVTLTSLAASAATITYRNIESDQTVTTTDDGKASENGAVDEGSGSYWLIWVAAVIGFLILLWALIAFFKKRGGSDKGSGYGTGTMGNSSAGGKGSSNTSSNASVTSSEPNTFIPTDVPPTVG